jgi:hypothetical protein
MLRVDEGLARALRCTTVCYAGLGATTLSMSHSRVPDPAPVDKRGSYRGVALNIGLPEDLLLDSAETSPAMLCLYRTVSRAPEQALTWAKSRSGRVSPDCQHMHWCLASLVRDCVSLVYRNFSACKVAWA